MDVGSLGGKYFGANKGSCPLVNSLTVLEVKVGALVVSFLIRNFIYFNQAYHNKGCLKVSYKGIMVT